MPLKVSDGIGAYIKDFQKSDAPQFKGKNKEERRDMAIAAYLTAKRGPEKEQKVQDEAMDAKRKAEMDRAMAAFKKRGGKITKVAPGRAQGAHGKDDPASGMRGMLDRGDTKKFKTRKKIRSMGESVMEAVDPKMRKVKQLATLGLVGKSDVNKLMMAMKSMDKGEQVKPQHRKIIFDAFADLIDLVTGDTQVFQKAKKKVKEQYDYGTDDSVKHMKKVTPGQTNEKKLMKGIDVDDDTLRMFKANPKMVPNSPVFRRLDPKTQKAVKKHLGIR